MDIKKIFINLIIVLFFGIILLSVVTVIKRNHEPEEEYVPSNNTQSMIIEDVTEVEVVMESTESSEVEDSQVEETKTMYVIGSVNVRSGPGREYSLVGNLSQNMEVTVLGVEEDGWQKILYQDTEAFVSGEYLSESPVEVAPEGSTPLQPEVTPTPVVPPTPIPEAPQVVVPETPTPEIPTPEEPVVPEPEPTPEPTPEPEPEPEISVDPPVEPEITPDPPVVEEPAVSETPTEEGV